MNPLKIDGGTVGVLVSTVETSDLCRRDFLAAVGLLVFSASAERHAML